jgi:hypothetical protein
VAPFGGSLEERLAHLRAAGVVQADEEDGRRWPRNEPYSIDIRHFNR